MLHPLVLLIVMSLILYDSAGLFVGAPMLSGPWTAATLLGGMALIALGTHLTLMVAGRRLDRTGSFRALKVADAALTISRLAIGGLFVVAVFALDWVGVVRQAVGDWVGVDEALIGAPPMIVYALGWWSFYPIERRLHEAAMLRMFDEGRSVHLMPRRIGYTWEKLRYSALAALVPLALILMWGEAATWAALHTNVLPWPVDDDRSTLALAGAQMAGAVLVLILSPPILMALWDTIPMPAGELRDRLGAMCRRHRVRCGSMRLWRTRGLILNGAVVGVIPRLRFLLLTDALIENLSSGQLEAVMAHEVGHIRRRHLPWLLASLVVAFGWAVWGMDAILGAVFGESEIEAQTSLSALDVTGSALAIAVGLVVFGFVSRLFERQADAFAVQDACGMTRSHQGAGAVVTVEAAETMAGALDAVARFNHIPRDKFTWRHGSIAGRCRRIRGLVGAPVDRLAVNRASLRVRIAIAVGLAALIVVTLVDAGINGP